MPSFIYFGGENLYCAPLGEAFFCPPLEGVGGGPTTVLRKNPMFFKIFIKHIINSCKILKP